MKVFFRNFFIALLPLVFALIASWGFAFSQDKCGRLVGPIFAPKCHWIQLEYQLKFQTAGTLFGCLVAALVASRLERRRRRAIEALTSTEGA